MLFHVGITGIQHITFSTRGGAGGVACELNRGIALTGVKTEVISVTDGAIPDLKFKKPILVITALFDFYIVRSRRSHHLFTLFRRFILIKPSVVKHNSRSILHLHWTPGIISMKQIAKQLQHGKRMVWTLHDMWAFTGGCHFSDSCLEFSNSCSHCPQVKSIFQTFVQRSLNHKTELLTNTRSLKIVTPSHWLKSQVLLSKALSEKDIAVIPNPIDCNVFKPNSSSQTRQSDFVIGCSAANLMETRKGISLLVKWTENYVSNFPWRKLTILAIGSGQLKSEIIDIRLTGFVSDKKYLSDLYNEMDIFVSLATSENLPLNVAEAVASGLPVICSDSGGISELIDHGESGFVASSEEEFRSYLSAFFSNPELIKEMGASARSKALSEFDTPMVVKKYLDLYSSF
jgi:glycosyltransferase involved in cell wall biosynthesis